MFKEEIEYIRQRIKELGLFQDQQIKDHRTFLITSSNTYSFSMKFINDKNLRCELNKKEIIGGMIFAGKVMTSVVISDWQRPDHRIKKIDDWIENFLLIPEIKLLLRSRKINKICQNDK